jgi:hypothetical protein
MIERFRRRRLLAGAVPAAALLLAAGCQSGVRVGPQVPRTTVE